MTSCSLLDHESPRAAPVDHPATLDEVIVTLWEELGADQTVVCPICGADMRPEYGVHARAIGGRCSTCGSVLR